VPSQGEGIQKHPLQFLKEAYESCCNDEARRFGAFDMRLIRFVTTVDDFDAEQAYCL
jgi:hypothetical protein